MDAEYILCNNLMMRKTEKGLTGYELMLYKQLCETLEKREYMAMLAYESEIRKQEYELGRTEEDSTRKTIRRKKSGTGGEQSPV